MTTLLGPPEWPDAPPTAPAPTSITGLVPTAEPGPAPPPANGPTRPGSHRLRDGVGLVLVVVGATLLALGNAAVWVAETATALGLREGTVKSRLHRALQSLQSALHHLDPKEQR